MSFGIISALLMSLLAVGKDVVSKKISTNIDPVVSSFTSFLFAIPFYLILLFFLYLLGLEDFLWQPGFWGYVLLRAVSDVGAETGKMIALKSGELSTVSAILSLQPIFTLILSPIITGDKITPEILIGVVLATMGTYFFTRTPSKISKKTFFSALATSLFFALNDCFARLSAISASAAFSGFAMNLLAAVLTLPLALVVAGSGRVRSDTVSNRQPLWLRGAMETTFMTAKLLALSALQAPIVSAIMRCNLVFQVIAGKAYFHEKGLIFRLIGCLLIIAGALVSLS